MIPKGSQEDIVQATEFSPPNTQGEARPKTDRLVELLSWVIPTRELDRGVGARGGAFEEEERATRTYAIVTRLGPSPNKTGSLLVYKWNRKLRPESDHIALVTEISYRCLPKMEKKKEKKLSLLTPPCYTFAALPPCRFAVYASSLTAEPDSILRVYQPESPVTIHIFLHS
ncbi:hypothetical protein GX48_03134 [Paracoccidioides brasiliensis]|nr:hypothetical protein GX48_03134 [Paracoccidioides brasiliensis]